MIKKTAAVAVILLFSIMVIWAAWEGDAAADSREEFPAGFFAASSVFPKYTLLETLVQVANLEKNGVFRSAAAIGEKKKRAYPVREVGVPQQPLAVPTAPSAAPREMTEPMKPEAAVPSVPSLVLTVGIPQQPLAVPTAPSAAPREMTEPMKPEAASLPAPELVSVADELERLTAQTGQSAEAEKPVRTAASIQMQTDQSTTGAVNKNTALVPRVPQIAASQGPISDGGSRMSVMEIAPIAAEASIPAAELLPEAAPAASGKLTESFPIEHDGDGECKGQKRSNEPLSHSEKPSEDSKSCVIPNKAAVKDKSAVTETTDSLIQSMQNTAGNIEPEGAQVKEILSEEYRLSQDTPTSLQGEPLQDEVFQKHVMLVPTGKRSPSAGALHSGQEPENTRGEGLPKGSQLAEKHFSDDTLKKGAFYVQIGRFKYIQNVEGFVQEFGKEYPVVVEKFSPLKRVEVFYRVYIGPLKKDEHGAVLETFREIGFKDAFLKRIY